MWATVGASDNPCSNSYHGPEAFSEAITTVIAEYTAGLDLRLYIDHHCCGAPRLAGILGTCLLPGAQLRWCVRAGDMFLQPFGATIELPADHEAIDRLGAIAKEATVRATKRKTAANVPSSDNGEDCHTGCGARAELPAGADLYDNLPRIGLERRLRLRRERSHVLVRNRDAVVQRQRTGRPRPAGE